MTQYALYPASVFIHFQESQKTDKEKPRWFMVDLTFKSRAKHLVPLTLLKQIAESPPDQVPEDISYIGAEGCKAIRGMSPPPQEFSTVRHDTQKWTLSLGGG